MTTSNPMVLAGLAIGAFLMSLVLTKLTILVAHRKGLLAAPTEDRWHHQPTPAFGGVAIFVTFMVGIAVVSFIERPSNEMLGVLAGGALMFGAGLYDDLKDSPPLVKLLFQFVAAAIAMTVGIYFDWFWFSGVVALPLTVLWIVGLTNAFNLLDNMDGLSGGIAAITCINMLLFQLAVGQQVLLVPAAILLGALLGFLVFNFHPAKIFMGDCGALFIGFTIASLSIIGSKVEVSNLALTILFPLLVVAIPIFDTTLVTVLRNLAGKKVTEGGKDHSSHRLVALGLSERNAVLLLYMISLAAGGVVLSYVLLPTTAVVVIAILLTVSLFYFGRFLAQAHVYSPTLPPVSESVVRLPRRFVLSVLGRRREISQLLIDFILVAVSIATAYLLRFDGELSKQNVDLLVRLFPVLIPIKLLFLYVLGAYRPMWRFMSLRDIFTLIKAGALGSVVTLLVIVMWHRFDGFSRAVFVIDFVLFVLLAIASRMFIKLLNDSFMRMQASGSDVLIYGAGEAGNLLLQEIYGNDDLAFRPIGFVDDDGAKKGGSIQGVPILGGRDALAGIVDKRELKTVILAIPSLRPAESKEIFSVLKQLGLGVLRFIPARIETFDNPGIRAVPDVAEGAGSEELTTGPALNEVDEGGMP